MLRRALGDFTDLFLNSIVAHIPSWSIRKFLYKTVGQMSIGSGSRILMGCYVQGSKGISIGKHTYINRGCHIDGRGGVNIGNNCNISNYSVILSATHDMESSSFRYRTGNVCIEDYCWLGTRAVVLDRSHLAQAVVVSAGSVLKGETEPDSVYMGIPAKKVKERHLNGPYDVVWKPYFI